MSTLVFNQGSAFTNISAVTESGCGGELYIDLSHSEQTFGVSECANAILQKVSEFVQHFFEPVSLQKLQRSMHIVSSPLERASGDEVDSTFRQIESQVMETLEVDPIEDGYSHPAEVSLDRVIQDYGYYAGDWLIDVLSSDHWNVSLRAGLLRLLSRLKPLNREWRLRVIQLGLSSSNLQLRDAAIQAAESWEDTGTVKLFYG